MNQQQKPKNKVLKRLVVAIASLAVVGAVGLGATAVMNQAEKENNTVARASGDGAKSSASDTYEAPDGLRPDLDVGMEPSDGSSLESVEYNPASGGDVTNVNAVDGRKISRSGLISISVKDPDKGQEAAAKVRAIAADVGGYVSNESVTDSRYGISTITIQVPNNKMDETMTILEKEVGGEYGEVTKRSMESEDVTEISADIDSRISTLKASITRLEGMMVKATTISEMTELEREISFRQSELESLEAQKRAIDSSVATSTITVNLSIDSSAPEPPADNQWAEIWNVALEGFINVCGIILVGLAVLAPFAVIAGVVTLIVWRRRKAKNKKADLVLQNQGVSQEQVAQAEPNTQVKPTE